jgi:hypothetical protein
VNHSLSVYRFRWVALQLEQLRTCYTLDGLRTTLASLPQGLEDTYVRILSKVSEPNRNIVHKLLYWIIFAEVPLNLEAAAETVKLDVDDAVFYSESRRLRNNKTLLRLRPSLITLIPKTEESDPELVTLSHASVKEFLLSSRINGYAIECFYISETLASVYVAETCVAYLSHCFAARQIYVDPTWYSQKVKDFPLVEYTRMFWDTHVRKSQTKDTTRLTALVRKFVSSLFLSRFAARYHSSQSYPSRTSAFATNGRTRLDLEYQRLSPGVS